MVPGPTRHASMGWAYLGARSVPSCGRSERLQSGLVRVCIVAVVDLREIHSRRSVDGDGSVGWSWSAEAGTVVVRGPSMAWAIGQALASPMAIKMRCRGAMTNFMLETPVPSQSGRAKHAERTSRFERDPG